MSLNKVLDNDKRFKDFAAKHTQGYEDTEKALEIVKKFIIDKNLIIYGGMAVDGALKAKGHKGIYKADEVPDYDFMSPTHYEHACELAILLDKHGFKDCQAVNAVHVSTYKVRTNFVWVADITYIPTNVFKAIPTISYQGMRMVHPDFQRLDMHRAMATPFEKPPMEVCLHRSKKDQKRYRMLDALYPVKVGAVECEKPQEKIWTVPASIYADNVVGGAQAYCAIWMVMNELLNGKSKLAKSVTVNDALRARFAKLPTGGFENKDKTLTFKLGITCPLMDIVNIISDDFEATLDKLPSVSKKAYYNKYIDDLRPRTIVVNADNMYEIYDNKSRLLPVYDLSNIFKLLELPALPSLKVCTTQYILMYYLQKYFGGGFVTGTKPTLDKPQKKIFLRMYVAMQELIEIAESLYLECTSKVPDAKAAVDKIFVELPFFLTDKTYGSSNWSPDYIVNVRESNYFINYVPIQLQPVMKPPRGFYLKGPVVPFDRSKSEFFQFDGQECEPFKPLELMTLQKVDTSQSAQKKQKEKVKQKVYLKWYDLSL
jgi:hypothetical protein